MNDIADYIADDTNKGKMEPDHEEVTTNQPTLEKNDSEDSKKRKRESD